MTARLAELTRCRAFHGLTEDDCYVWFGVGPGTLERIEAGEVEPSEDLEQRIDRFLKAVGGGAITFPPPLPGAELAHGAASMTGAGTAVAPGPRATFRDEGDTL